MYVIAAIGEHYRLSHDFYLPEYGSTPFGLALEMWVATAGTFAGADAMKTSLQYRVRGKDESAVSTLYEIPKHFKSTDGLTANKWRRFRYVIGSSKFPAGKSGGVVTSLWNFLSTSTGPEMYIREFQWRRLFVNLASTDQAAFA